MAKAKTKPPLRLEWIDPATLPDNPANWRRHPARQLDALRDVFAEVGWAGALLYNERTKRLIDGHARKQVAAGGEPVPVLIGNWSEEEERKILATLDPLAALAEADNAQLDKLLDDMQFKGLALDEMVQELAAELEVQAGERSGEHRDLGDKKAQIKPVLYADQVAVFERALAATGKSNRAEALIEVCRAYLEEPTADAKGQ